MKVIEFYKPKEKSTKRSLIIIDGSIFLARETRFTVFSYPATVLIYSVSDRF